MSPATPHFFASFAVRKNHIFSSNSPLSGAIMSRIKQQFGSVTLGRARNAASLKRLLNDPWLKANTVIIKPNWVQANPGLFTDASTLRLLFETLDSKIVVTEGYQIHRMLSEREVGMKFTVKGKDVDWKWLMRGEGWKWLTEQENWDWFRNTGQWDYLRKQDKSFLEENGFTDLFKEYNAKYVNVTEEVWQGRIASVPEVKKTVETKFAPVFADKLYGYVPQKLYKLRGTTLISFAKVKHYASFTMKNLFGLIPDPARAWWHGPSNKRFDKSLVDINKIYTSLFNVFGFCEALRCTPVSHAQGEFGESGMRYNVVRDLGIVAFGRHLVSLDATLFSLLGLDPGKIGFLKLGEEAFGAYEKGHVEAARASATDWFSFQVPS